MERNALHFTAPLLALAWILTVGATRAGAQALSPRTPAAGLVPVLAALDRPVQSLDLQNASAREVFAQVARIGGIRVVLDSSVPADLRLNVKLKGVRLGDALTMICQPTGLRLLPGNGCLIVTPASSGAHAGGRPAQGSPVHNPWAGWSEVTGLPLGPAGETGYPRLAPPLGAPGPALMTGAPLTCSRCQAPVFPYWAYCPYCGQQRLTQRFVGKFCWGCGRPVEEEHDHLAAPGRK